VLKNSKQGEGESRQEMSNIFFTLWLGVLDYGATAPQKSEKNIETNRMCALANTACANFAK